MLESGTEEGGISLPETGVCNLAHAQHRAGLALHFNIGLAVPVTAARQGKKTKNSGGQIERTLCAGDFILHIGNIKHPGK